MSNNFFFSSVNKLLMEIRLLISVSDHNMRLVEALGGPNREHVKNDPNLPDATRQSIDTVDFVVKTSESLFVDLKCDHITGATKSLGYWRASGLLWSELNTRSRALKNAIEIELKQYLYYQYPKAKGLKLKSCNDDWKSSVTAFPTIAQDAFDSTDCYALGHNTASVFHSMRVAEHGLRALA